MLSKAARILKELQRMNLDNTEVCAVVAAAGSSSRMGGGDKLLTPLCGHTALEWSVQALADSMFIKSILIVCRAEALEAYRELPLIKSCPKPVEFALGGDSRQKSVQNAMTAVLRLFPNARVVAIHDGARPAVSTSDIDACIMACLKHGAAAAANPVVDTLKKVTSGFAKKTVSRSDLWAVQTPQVFLRDVYLVSLAKAQKEGLDVTDDCALAENAGFEVYMQPCSRHNIKLTVPEDAAALESILRSRTGGAI